MTFSEFITAVYAEIQNKTTTSLTLLKAATVRQLRELSSHRTLFMEDTFRFDTVVGQDTYNSATGGFPKDAMQIDALWYVSGSSRYEVPGPITMQEARFERSEDATQQYPSGWAWFGDSLVLRDVPSAVVTLEGDYFKDATRDEGSGVEITTSSTTQTNPWFDRGEIVLRNAVLAEFYSLPINRDAEAANNCLGMRNQFLQTLKDEWMLKRATTVQAPLYLGDFIYDPVSRL